jgi:hypothetical protein
MVDTEEGPANTAVVIPVCSYVGAEPAAENMQAGPRSEAPKFQLSRCSGDCLSSAAPDPAWSLRASVDH